MGGGEERVGGGEADAWGVLVVVVAVWGYGVRFGEDCIWTCG